MFILGLFVFFDINLLIVFEFREFLIGLIIIFFI